MAALNKDMLTTRSGQFDLESIQRVNLSKMALGKVELLQQCTSLVSLNLAGNMMSSLTQLGTMPKLRSLDVSSNRLVNLDGLEGLTTLEHLRLEGNRISELAELDRLACLVNLRTLSFRSSNKKTNPVCSHPTYFTQIQCVLGQHRLQQVDGENLLLRDTAQRLMLEHADVDETDVELPPAVPWDHERLLRIPATRPSQEVLELETALNEAQDECKSLDAEAAILISKVTAEAALRIKEARAKMKAEAERNAPKQHSTRQAEPHR